LQSLAFSAQVADTVILGEISPKSEIKNEKFGIRSYFWGFSRQKWSFSHALAGGINMDKWFIFAVFRCFEGQAFYVLAMNLLLFLFRVRAQKEISWQLLHDRTSWIQLYYLSRLLALSPGDQLLHFTGSVLHGRDIVINPETDQKSLVSLHSRVMCQSSH
jgi:hypothetical protein